MSESLRSAYIPIFKQRMIDTERKLKEALEEETPNVEYIAKLRDDIEKWAETINQ